MHSNKFAVVLARFEFIVVLCSKIAYAYPSTYSNEPLEVNDSGRNGDYGSGHVIPQFNFHYAQQQNHRPHENQKQQQHPNLTHFITLKPNSTATSASSGPSFSSLATESSSLISATSANPFLQSAYVYKAVPPTHIEPETNKVVSSIKPASATSTSPTLLSSSATPVSKEKSHTSHTNNYSNINFEKDDELSRKIIGSSVVTSVSVVLNGDQPEFTDALGQKVPKPQQSLQVASPIDLLNPDRYEFYTFDDHGELVKRLMTMEEIQSIVANGDGEGPTIIHHGPIEDRDPEKNVQDIVNSVQSVLNKEVESNKNSSTESLPVFDTPDVSSSWSMILPAIFGNTGNVDIFAHQKPQQIVMTPDTEIIEISTTASVSATTKRPKPNKRKPGQKRKPTTTTTDMTPQVIQEELDSQESVYTGMQQYQNLAASLQNYDGFSQLNMQPMYHKLPEIETSTRVVFINNQEVVKKPITLIENHEVVLNEKLAKKPLSEQLIILPPNRVKKPNGNHITTKRPQASKQKIKRKPTTTTTTAISSTRTNSSTDVPTATSTTTLEPTNSITTIIIPTTEPITMTNTSKTTIAVPASTASTNITPLPSKTYIPTSTATAASTTKAQKNKKKKPTRHPVNTTSTISGESTEKLHLTAQNRKPSPKPHRHRPKPVQQHTEYAHITPASDLAAEGTAHQEISHNKFQQVAYHKTHPKPYKPNRTTPTSAITTKTTTARVPPTTVVFAPIPVPTTSNPIDVSLIVQDFPGYQQTVSEHAEALLSTRITTIKPHSTTSVNIPSTAGYPVPSYGISIDESNGSGIIQYNKPPLPSLLLTQHGSQTYEQDTHTLQSFDQIMQTLKEPEKKKEVLSDNNANTPAKLNLKPVRYDSAENKDQLDVIANKHMLPLQNYTKHQPSSTLKPPNDQYEGNNSATTLIDFEATSDLYESLKTTIYDESKTEDVMAAHIRDDITTSDLKESNQHTESTDLTSLTSFTDAIKELSTITEVPETTHILSQKENEKTTEYSIVEQKHLLNDIHTQETSIYDSTSINLEQSSVNNNDENSTNKDQETKEYTGHLKIETVSPEFLPYKEETNISNASHPVLVANLKPQLNMKVIKPSEQITMSDFQTQAATVASTLVDGTNTIPTESSMISSNETSDEIALLMSDVIHQISNTNDIFKTQLTNSNDNRYSNQAQLNLSFLLSPNKVEPHKTTSIAPIEEESHYQQNFKPIYERLENTSTTIHESENLYKVSTAYFSTTEIPEGTTLVEFDGESLEKMTPTYTTQNEEDNLETTTSSDTFDSGEESLITTLMQNDHDHISSEIKKNQTESSDSYNEESFILKLDKKDDNDNSTPSVTSKENATTSLTTTETDDKITTLTVPILTLFGMYPHQQQKLEIAREPLFEAGSSVDTTTLIDALSEETTTLFSESHQSSSKQQENSNNEKIKLSESNIENESIYESSENNLKSEITTLKDYSNEDDQGSTDISYETSEDKLNLIDIESNTNKTETAEVLEFNHMGPQTDAIELTTSINKDSMPAEWSESESNGIDEELHYTTTNGRVMDNSNQNEGTTAQYTTSKEVDTPEDKTFKIEEVIQATTTIYQMSEETSAELNAMISEEDETGEFHDEDPYIKLGETTTLNPELHLELKIQNMVDNKSGIEFETGILLPEKPVSSTIETNIPTGTPSMSMNNYSESFEEADEEDEEDQFGYHQAKLPNPDYTITTRPTTITKTTTTSKPEVTTTRRLNTLKPVSYFNKQPAYALYQEPVEPLYNKKLSQSSYPHQNIPPKVVTFTIPTPQQRPMQRPPQLSNLMISATQATRPPVKLEPSPNNSKGLEASLENLDADILAFARLCNELAFSYWKSITSEKISSARSLVMSPFALTSMLSMVFLGARGSTSGEMNDVLKLDDMVTFNPHLVFKNITDSIEKSMDSDIATTAFVREIYSDRANGKVLQFFKEKTQQLYAGHVEEVNFHVVNDIIRRRTNLLVKRHTMGKVLEYLRTNSVWVNGPLATISANLFQTDCSHGSTQDRDGEIFFQVHPTVRQRRLVPIPAVLFKTGFTAGYEPNLDATVVAFGRIQDTTSMIYVMPGHLSSTSPTDNLDRLEKQLIETAISKNSWSNLLTSLMDRPGMEIQIPRFSHRSFVNATLGLQKMGLKGLFKSDYADLGGLTGSSNRDIYLSDMIQINTFSTCGEEKIADHHHVEMYPAPPLRKRNKDVDAHDDDEQDSSEAIIDFGSLVQDSVLGRGFYDDLLDPKYLELPLPLRPRQARVPDAPRLRFDKPFLYFVRHNPTGMLLFMGRFNPRLLP